MATSQIGDDSADGCESVGEAGPAGNSSKDDLPAQPEIPPACCGPGCDCGAPARGGKAKTAVCAVVLVAIAGIIAFKALTGKPAEGANGGAVGFTVPSTANNNTPEKTAPPEIVAVPESKTVPEKIVEAGAPVESVTTEKKKDAPPAAGDTQIGKYLESMGELNKVALDQDAVFVFIPAKEKETAEETTKNAVLSAQKTLGAKNLKVGLYTLKTASADYTSLSTQVQAPAILVVYKGRGMGAVTGEVTETKLLQTFTAASRAGGCGPAASGCGPSSGGCR